MGNPVTHNRIHKRTLVGGMVKQSDVSHRQRLFFENKRAEVQFATAKLAVIEDEDTAKAAAIDVVADTTEENHANVPVLLALIMAAITGVSVEEYIRRKNKAKKVVLSITVF